MNANNEKIFGQQGTLLYTEEEAPLTQDEWRQLEDIVGSVEYEHIVGGDAGESHSVWVCRFYNDVEKPVALHDKSPDVYRIVMSDKMKSFYSAFTGTDRLCLRRCQANKLNEGDYIGIHKDQDSNPDYYATVVFHFGSKYDGGDFVSHRSARSVKSYHPMHRTLLVNNCSLPHEVSKVTSGERLTLACFLSKEFGDSKNTRKHFKVIK